MGKREDGFVDREIGYLVCISPVGLDTSGTCVQSKMFAGFGPECLSCFPIPASRLEFYRAL